MPDQHEGYETHRASHFVGGSDPISPGSLGGAGIPKIMYVSGDTSIDITLGGEGKSLVPMYISHTVTNGAGVFGDAQATITFYYSDGTLDQVYGLVPAASSRIYVAHWDDPTSAASANTAAYAVSSTPGVFHITPITTASSAGKVLQRIGLGLSGGNSPTSTATYQYVEM